MLGAASENQHVLCMAVAQTTKICLFLLSCNASVPPQSRHTTSHVVEMWLIFLSLRTFARLDHVLHRPEAV